MALGNVLGAVGDALADGASSVLDRLTDQTQSQYRSFEQDGFIVPPIPSASGDGLPSSKVPSQRQHINKRHIIHWFVPEVGIINMYVNPESIDYSFKKLITPERTKGGYVIQYWGEDLPRLSIRGTTGSSGVEGLNVLYEIYRSEQLTFDPIALTMASDSTVSGVRDLIGDIGSLGNIGSSIAGGFANGVSSLTNGILGLNPLTQSILPRNPSTLASLALSIELYYNGWVFRGYFDSFNVHETKDELGLFRYEMQFVVTQRRGYRLNFMPWHKSAISGPSNWDQSGPPLSYGQPGKVKLGNTQTG